MFTKDKLKTHIAAPELHNEKHKSRKQEGEKGSTTGGKEEKVSEDIRPCLSLHKFPLLF